MRDEFGKYEELAYSPVEAPDWRDGNAVARFRVLSGLQFDRKEDDYDLLQFILEQEVLRAENDPRQGCGEPLQLAAWLVCRYRKPPDFALMVRGKLANFDTGCGFDPQYLYFCGIERTGHCFAEWLRFRPQDERVRELSTRYSFTEQDLESWRQERERWFPNQQDEEPLDALADRFQALGEVEEALRCLEIWESTNELSPAQLRSLEYRRRELGPAEPT